jgi:hypothetical protein
MLRQCSYDRHIRYHYKYNKKKQGNFMEPIYVLQSQNEMQHIYLLNRNLVDTRWQQYSTHLHTNNTQKYRERNILNNQKLNIHNNKKIN